MIPPSRRNSSHSRPLALRDGASPGLPILQLRPRLRPISTLRTPARRRPQIISTLDTSPPPPPPHAPNDRHPPPRRQNQRHHHEHPHWNPQGVRGLVERPQLIADVLDICPHAKRVLVKR